VVAVSEITSKVVIPIRVVVVAVPAVVIEGPGIGMVIRVVETSEACFVVLVEVAGISVVAVKGSVIK
jgi:hypothetical protein